MKVELGTIRVPSGTLLIVDPGLLGMWAHDRPPNLPAGLLDEETTERANAAVDSAIVGADAERVGKQLGRQWHPRFVFDLPRTFADQLAQEVKRIATTEHLDARLEVLAERVSHRRRADHALTFGNGAGEIQFHGNWAGVISGIPSGELRVTGERMPAESADHSRLRRITITARDGVTARSEQFAMVMVDWARLMAVDLDALDRWTHNDAIDGKADVAFWGRDAESVARRLSASQLEDGVFGWRDLPVEEAARRGSQVEELREREPLRFATDFRPHSHHYQLMEQVRGSPTESGVVALGDARACGFMTTWGDGIYEVHRDLDADGRLLAIRIELGTEQRIELMRRVELRAKAALVSNKVAKERKPIRWLFRQEPDNEIDSGWRVFAGDEDDAYNSDVANVSVVGLDHLGDLDEKVDALFDAPVGTAFERATENDEFTRVTEWSPED